MESLKHELMIQKESHALTIAKNDVPLAMTNKWEGNVIDKEEKLSKALQELNEKLRNFKELREA